MNINYTKTKQAWTTKLGRKKGRSDIYLVSKNECKNARNSKVINIWKNPAEAGNLANPGLGISPEPLGCGSTDSCFDISVQRSFFCENLKSVALLVTEIKKFRNINFEGIQVYINIMTLLCLLRKNDFWSLTLFGT